jgi:cbb3-type cytochrome c oxidase subunit II
MVGIGIVLIGLGYYIWKKVPERSALLTSAGIWLVFTIGLVYVLILPSFNQNWSYATAKNLEHYHVQYARADGTTWGYTPSQERGRLIYQREGCMYCHTQQVRPLEGEMKRYSVGTSLAIPADEREYVYDTPHFLGTRRIGPDLSRVGGKYSDDWHYSHFYYPRQMVPDSIMPAFTWLFVQKGDAPPVPTQDCKDLVAYVQTLGYGRQVYDQSTHQWRSWLKAEDQQGSQETSETAVERIVPIKTGKLWLAHPVRGGDQQSPTNVVAPPAQ